MAKDTLTVKDYAAPTTVEMPTTKEVEATYVDQFVKGRPLVNEGNRLVNAAKGYFQRSGKTKWKGSTHKITATADSRAGFDMNAFKLAHPKLYAQFYKANLPMTTYEIEEI